MWTFHSTAFLPDLVSFLMRDERGSGSSNTSNSESLLILSTLGAEIDYETAVPDNVRNISIKLDDETGQITSYSLNGVEIFIAKQSV